MSAESGNISSDFSEPATYSEMLDVYLSESEWISSADQPLVFHLRRLCKQMDDLEAKGADVKAALSSTYNQTFERLDRRRPRREGEPTDPAQTSIFDHIED